jgi:hypothetical protein
MHTYPEMCMQTQVLPLNWVSLWMPQMPESWNIFSPKWNFSYLTTMHECKTKHINIYMSFSNRPNLVTKARSETKKTHMNHSKVKALPQVIYWNIGMWQSKFSDLSSFIKRWLTSSLKAYPCHIVAKNMHIIQRSYKEIKFLTKDHWKHP